VSGDVLDGILASGLPQTAGWILAHSLWQAALVALALAATLRLLPRSRLRLRSAATLGALLSVLILVSVTGTALFRDWVAHERCWTQAVAHGSATSTSCGAHGVPVEADGPVVGEGAVTKPDAVLAGVPAGFRLPGLARPVALVVTTVAALGAYLWIAASLLGVGALVVGLHRLHRVVRTARPVRDPRVLRTFREMVADVGCRRPVSLRESAAVETACVARVLHPIILLPYGLLGTMDETDLRATLAHELAHVARGDYVVGLLVLAARALVPFNPALAWISARIGEEREAACDQVAIEVGTRSGARYAQTLLLLEGLRQFRHLPGPAATLLGEEDLLRRIRRVGAGTTLAPSVRAVVGRVLAAAAVWVAIALLLLALLPPLLSLGSWAVMQGDLNRRQHEGAANVTAPSLVFFDLTLRHVSLQEPS
jgi:beta-lactamase regulating signal transducer with metallopeptidase domain